jgi:hypothetical protein
MNYIIKTLNQNPHCLAVVTLIESLISYKHGNGKRGEEISFHNHSIQPKIIFKKIAFISSLSIEKNKTKHFKFSLIIQQNLQSIIHKLTQL